MIPERLKSVLDILVKFHTRKVMDTTESTKKPNSMILLREQLSLDGIILSQFIESDGKYIDPRSDDDLKHCINELTLYLYPPDAYISTMAIYWIGQMFEEAPFTLSIDHIQRMKNSIDVDGKEHDPKEIS